MNDLNMAIGKIAKVYRLLEDEISKEIYMARLEFLVTKDYNVWKPIVEKYVSEVTFLNGKTIGDLIQSLPEEREIVLYGAGGDAKAYLAAWEKDKRFIGFCDRDVEKQRNGFFNHPVISPEQLLQKNVSVVISTHREGGEIREFLEHSGFPKDKIYEMAPYILCGERGQYLNVDFMTFGEEVFVDAGCYNMETSQELIKYCSHLKKVYAFEPDENNYNDCIQRKAEFSDTEIELFPYGTWSDRRVLHFSATANGSSHICENGETSIQVMPIDEAVAGKEPVTFIKMDVEGAELESLKGAQNTILKDKPKLAVCIYHKPEDMVEVPLYIKELVPEYKLYIRHHSNGSNETVLYAVMP